MKISLMLALIALSSSAFAAGKYQNIRCKSDNGLTASALLDISIAVADMNEEKVSTGVLTLKDEKGKAILKSDIAIHAFGIFGNQLVFSSAGVSNDEDVDALKAHIVSLSFPESFYGKAGSFLGDVSYDAMRENYVAYGFENAKCTSTIK